MSAIGRLAPGLRIDQVRNAGQSGHSGKGDAGRPIATTDALMGSLPIRVSRKGFSHLTTLLQGLGRMEPQTLLGERAMVPLHKPVLWWVIWIAEEHRDSEGLTKTDQGGRKVTALRSSDPASIAVPRNGGR